MLPVQALHDHAADGLRERPARLLHPVEALDDVGPLEAHVAEGGAVGDLRVEEVAEFVDEVGDVDLHEDFVAEGFVGGGDFEDLAEPGLDVEPGVLLQSLHLQAFVTSPFARFENVGGDDLEVLLLELAIMGNNILPDDFDGFFQPMPLNEGLDVATVIVNRWLDIIWFGRHHLPDFQNILVSRAIDQIVSS